MMKITGVAHPPARLYERSQLPSGELVYLAKRALKTYHVHHVVTSLEPGWGTALAKGALELDLPFTVAVPYPGRDADWDEKVRVQYLSLLARASEVYQISNCYASTAQLEGYFWQVQHSDAVLALWDYEFEGETFEVIDYALENNKQVLNLWKDWQNLYSMRRPKQAQAQTTRSKGAQIFDK